jgi:hypothetical protein
LVGSLIYLTNTRPDIAYSVGKVARYMTTPRQTHWIAAKRILRYIKGTLDNGIWYTRTGTGTGKGTGTDIGTGTSLTGYTDADWAGSLEDRKSTTGYVFHLGSGAVSWCSKKQHTIALSSTESEYRATSAAVKEVIWLRRILEDLQYKQEQPTTLWCDNQSVIKMVKNPVFHERTKHIEIDCHFIREQASTNQIKLEYCPTEEQTADILTKALGKDKFQQHRFSLGVMKVNIKEGC